MKKAGGFTIECRITPRAKKNFVKRVVDGVFHISLTAPPIEGRANEELIAFLASSLAAPHSNISIIMGKRGRHKVVAIQGMDKATAIKKLYNPVR